MRVPTSAVRHVPAEAVPEELLAYLQSAPAHEQPLAFDRAGKPAWWVPKYVGANCKPWRVPTHLAHACPPRLDSLARGGDGVAAAWKPELAGAVTEGKVDGEAREGGAGNRARALEGEERQLQELRCGDEEESESEMWGRMRMSRRAHPHVLSEVQWEVGSGGGDGGGGGGGGGDGGGGVSGVGYYDTMMDAYYDANIVTSPVSSRDEDDSSSPLQHYSHTAGRRGRDLYAHGCAGVGKEGGRAEMGRAGESESWAAGVSEVSGKQMKHWQNPTAGQLQEQNPTAGQLQEQGCKPLQEQGSKPKKLRLHSYFSRLDLHEGV